MRATFPFKNNDNTVVNGSASIVAGDFNGDGKLDIATSATPLNFFLGNGAGTFTLNGAGHQP